MELTKSLDSELPLHQSCQSVEVTQFSTPLKIQKSLRRQESRFIHLRIFFLTFAAFSSVKELVYSQKITNERSNVDLELVSTFFNDVDPGGLCGKDWTK